MEPVHLPPGGGHAVRHGGRDARPLVQEAQGVEEGGPRRGPPAGVLGGGVVHGRPDVRRGPGDVLPGGRRPAGAGRDRPDAPAVGPRLLRAADGEPEAAVQVDPVRGGLGAVPVREVPRGVSGRRPQERRVQGEEEGAVRPLGATFPRSPRCPCGGRPRCGPQANTSEARGRTSWSRRPGRSRPGCSGRRRGTP